MSEQHGHSTADKITDAADKVAGSVRKVLEDRIEAVRPTWEDKVAPRVATGAAKAAEWGDAARDQADKKAAELRSEDRPSSKILGGALGVGAAAVALTTGAVRWVGKEAGKAAHSEPAPHPEPEATGPSDETLPDEPDGQ